MEQTALVLAAGFLVAFGAGLWVVTRVFQARGWSDLGTPARPVRVRSPAVSRLLGALLTLAGCWFVWQSWVDAHAGHFFSFKAAAGGPWAIAMGVWVMIVGPVAPDDDSVPQPPLVAWVVTALGLAVGFLYEHHLETGRIPFFP